MEWEGPFSQTCSNSGQLVCYGIWPGVTEHGDEFFAELDTLTDDEIEQRLSIWDKETLSLVQEYIDRRQEEVQKAAAQIEIDRSAKDAALVALKSASRANTIATAALILAVGAMLAATAAGALFYLALSN